MKHSLFCKVSVVLLLFAMLLPMTVACSQNKKETAGTVAPESGEEKPETVNPPTPTQTEENTEPPVTIDPALQAEVDSLLHSKHKLTFNDDGSFRVLILADTHMNAPSDAKKAQNVKDRIKLLVDREKPNLVIFTGDNTINSTRDTIQANIDALVDYIEEKQIPWCHVYGNHDHESALKKEHQQVIYESYKYCISKTGPAISGTGNYVNGIYNKDGSLGAVIYCLDSGAYAATGGGYDYIKQDQIDWYKATSEKLQEYNGGKAVPALMAFHIPLIENMHAFQNKDNKELVFEFSGGKNEDICSSTTDTNLFETILERGDVKAIITGHDHLNDYMFNYMGVKLCSSPNFSEFIYNDAAYWGSRVFDLNLKTIDNIPTYVSYINERYDSSQFDPYTEDVTLTYTNETIQNALIQNWGAGTLSGTASIAITDKHGVDNSDALAIKRSEKSNFEIYFEITNKGKLCGHKYLIVWADFTNVEFRKACFGLYGEYGKVASYRTDDADYITPFYYLADGATEWVTLHNGKDGCFGVGDTGSQAMKGKKGYFAIPVANLKKGSETLTGNSLIAGFYFYGSLNDNAYGNVPFYLDSIMLVNDYKNFK